jgi:hypothetical protein
MNENQPRVPAGQPGGGEWTGDVNQAEIVSIKRMNDSMDTVTLKHHPSKRDSSFPVDTALGGTYLNSGTERPGRSYVNVTETNLKVGDRITTKGEVIEGGGNAGKESVQSPQRQTPDYRDTFAQEHRPR